MSKVKCRFTNYSDGMIKTISFTEDKTTIDDMLHLVYDRECKCSKRDKMFGECYCACNNVYVVGVKCTDGKIKVIRGNTPARKNAQYYAIPDCIGGNL